MLGQLRIMILLGVLVVAALVGFSLKSGGKKSLIIEQQNPLVIAQNELSPSLPTGYADALPEDMSEDEQYLPYVQVFFDPLIKSLLTAQVSAPITSINKRLGDAFEPNEPLINIYDVVYKAAIGKALGLLNKAQVGLTAKEALFKDKVASYFDVADYQAAVASANSDLAFANYQYSCCHINVPYPGYVAAVLVNDFETPQVGQPLIEVVDTRVLLAKMLFDSTYIDRLYVGQKIKITVREIGVTVEGKIARIAPVIDPASAKFKVEAEVPNVDGKIRPGMSGKITLKNLSASPSDTLNGGLIR